MANLLDYNSIYKNKVQGPGLGWAGDYYTPTGVVQSTPLSTLYGNTLGASTVNTTYGGGTTNQAASDWQKYHAGEGDQPAGYAGEGAGAGAGNLDDIYNPIMGALDQAGQFAGTSKDEALALADKSKASQLATLAGSVANSENKITGQETDLVSQRQSALAEARQLYNELSQYNQARFGTGTSAGPAAMEILGRETARSFGKVESEYGGGLRDINQVRADLDLFNRSETMRISDAYDSRQAQIMNDYRSTLNNINMQRAATESDKAAARYNALLERQSQLAMVKDQIGQWVYQLESFNQQMLAEQTGNLINIPQAVSNLNQYTGNMSAQPAQLLASAKVAGGYAQPTQNQGYLAGKERYVKLPDGSILDTLTGGYA